jgi:spoIIIJ-associated protein
VDKTIEAVGRTREEAVEKGLQQLNLTRDDVTVELIDRAKSGFLGLGSTPARVKITYSAGRTNKAESFLSGLFRHMNVNVETDIRENEDGNIMINLKGDDMGPLIGRHGETLDALQYLTSQVVNRNEDKRVRVVVDTKNYRKKREETLTSLATRTAEKAVKYKRNFTLEPMNSFERHVIHTVLQDFNGVTTSSIGSEPRRCVVVMSVEGGQPAGAQRRWDSRNGGRKPGMARPYHNKPGDNRDITDDDKGSDSYA